MLTVPRKRVGTTGGSVVSSNSKRTIAAALLPLAQTNESIHNKGKESSNHLGRSFALHRRNHQWKLLMCCVLVLMFGMRDLKWELVRRQSRTWKKTTNRLDFGNYPVASVPILLNGLIGVWDDDGHIQHPVRIRNIRDASPSEDRGSNDASTAKDSDKDYSSWYQHKYVAKYGATDDDAFLAEELDFDEDESSYETDHSGQCRRVAEHMLHFPTCTLIHEQDRLVQEAKLLGSGAYRQVFGVRNWGHYSTYNPDARLEPEHFALKQLRFELDHSRIDYRDTVRMDALVAERLTSHAHIVDVYGHCGGTVVTEFFFHGEIEHAQVIVSSGMTTTTKQRSNPRDWLGYADGQNEKERKRVSSYNKMTWEERLKAALDMSKGLAALHSYPGGVVVHGDAQVCQFLYNADKSILKLNDFNRAEWMLWDDERQEYCRYKNDVARGTHRAPEEYAFNPLNEKIDVYALGNALYMLLTGLYPFFEYKQLEKGLHKKAAMQGIRPFLHPDWKSHGFAAQALIVVMKECWTGDPDQRPSMGHVVQMLEAAWKTFQDKKNAKATITGK